METKRRMQIKLATVVWGLLIIFVVENGNVVMAKESKASEIIMGIQAEKIQQKPKKTREQDNSSLETKTKMQGDSEEIVFISTMQLQAKEMSSYRYYPTEEERKLLCYMVVGEAMGESYEGKVACVETILARLESKEYPNSINGICLSTAFACYKNGQICIGDRPVVQEDITEEVERAVEAACKGSTITEKLLKEEAMRLGKTDPKYWENGSLSFCNMKDLSEEEMEKRANVEVKVQIKNHTFYRY